MNLTVQNVSRNQMVQYLLATDVETEAPQR